MAAESKSRFERACRTALPGGRKQERTVDNYRSRRKNRAISARVSETCRRRAAHRACKRAGIMAEKCRFRFMSASEGAAQFNRRRKGYACAHARPGGMKVPAQRSPFAWFHGFGRLESAQRRGHPWSRTVGNLFCATVFPFPGLKTRRLSFEMPDECATLRAQFPVPRSSGAAHRQKHGANRQIGQPHQGG